MIVLLSASQLKSTICYVNQGSSPEGQQVFLLGLEHWTDDEESIKQAMYLAALFEKNKTLKFLVEYNDLYGMLAPKYGKNLSQPRAASYPHYAYAYDDLEEVVAGFATALVQGRMRRASNALSNLAITYSRHKDAPYEHQVCPATLFIDAVTQTSPTTVGRIIHIDPRRQYLMLSCLFTGIKRNPNLLLEELVPMLGINEDFLESFSMQDLIDITDTLIKDITIWQTKINVFEFKELINEWIADLTKYQTALKKLLIELEENICIALDLYKSELNLQSPALVFVDRWLKSFRVNKKRTSKRQRCLKVQQNISRVGNLLSDIFNYHAHIDALNSCMKTQSDYPIFLLAGTEHVIAAQHGLECLGYTFDVSTASAMFSLQPEACTSILHNIFTRTKRVICKTSLSSG